VPPIRPRPGYATRPAPWWTPISQTIRLENRRSHHLAGNISREPGAYHSRHLHHDASQQDTLSPFEYLEEAVSWYRGQLALLHRVASPDDIAPTSRAIDDMFRNRRSPRKPRAKKLFKLSSSPCWGNVKAFILSIAGCVLRSCWWPPIPWPCPSANVRGKSRCLRLWVYSCIVLSLFVGEAVALSSRAGAWSSNRRRLVGFVAHSPFATGILFGLRVSRHDGPAVVVALLWDSSARTFRLTRPPA